MSGREEGVEGGRGEGEGEGEGGREGARKLAKREREVPSLSVSERERGGEREEMRRRGNGML